MLGALIRGNMVFMILVSRETPFSLSLFQEILYRIAKQNIIYCVSTDMVLVKLFKITLMQAVYTLRKETLTRRN